MLTSQLCLQLALHLAACEHAVSALDAQYQLLAPLKQLERSLRVGVEARIGTKATEGLTLFIGPALDWQLRSRVYFSIEGKF